MPEFEGWPKIPRLNRNCVVTEKIDGTNACIVIEDGKTIVEADKATAAAWVPVDGDVEGRTLYCQSRRRFIRPDDDNYGFATWVQENALELAAGLGVGRHYGEWWGHGIQRNYGLAEKRFSLFNAGRWHDKEANGLGAAAVPDCCNVVPVLALGQFAGAPWLEALDQLSEVGSAASPGFNDPEGVIVYHTAAKSSFKITFEHDGLPKSAWNKLAEALQPSVEAASAAELA